MATITSVEGASGNWENPASWVGGALPTAADDVIIGNPRYLIASMSGTNGIALTFTINGHVFQNGDEVGLGADGVGPVPAPLAFGRKYFIVNRATNTFQLSLTSGGVALLRVGGYAGTNEINISKAYRFTMDSPVASARVALTVTVQTGVVLSVSRSVSTQIRTAGVFLIGRGAVMDYDLSAHPSITTKIFTWSSGVWDSRSFEIAAASNFHVIRGKPRKRRPDLLSTVTANVTTSFVVSDATGWEIGDTLVLSPTQPRNGSTTLKASTVTITGITPGSGTTATITFAGTGTGGNTTPNTHQTGGHVGNFSSNVVFESFVKTDGNTRGHVHLNRSNNSFANHEPVLYGGTDGHSSVFIENVLFSHLGQGWRRGLTVGFAGDIFDFSVGGVNDNAFFEHSGGLQISGGGTPCNAPSNRNVFFQTLQDGDIALVQAIATQDRMDGWGSFWSRNEQAFRFEGATVANMDDLMIAGSSQLFTMNGQSSPRITNSQFYCFDVGWYGTGQFRFEDTNFSKFVTGWTGNRPQMQRSTGNGSTYLLRCTKHVDQLWISGATNTPAPSPESSYVFVDSASGDATNQLIYSAYIGSIRPLWERDNVILKNSVSSIKGYFTGRGEQALTQQIPTVSGAPVRVVGFMRKNAAYGSATRPYVQIMGFGVTATATMTDVNDTWEMFTLDYVQNSGLDGPVSLRMAGRTASLTGNFWFSGITYAPLVTRARHYGYLFDESIPTRAVNPAVTVAQAVAAAYTGVTINTGTPQITVGAGTTNTFKRLYDYTQSWACDNPGLPVFLTSSDGNNFALPTTCRLSWPTMGADGTLVGGRLLLAATGTHTYKLSGTVVEFQTAGTYNMGETQFSGTVEFINTSGGAVTVSIPSGFTPTNTGPDITLSAPVLTTTIAAQVSLAGAEVRIYDLDNSPAGSLGTELAGVESCPGSTFSFSTAAGNSIWVQILLAGYKEYGQQLTAPSASTTFTLVLATEADA